MPHGKTSARSSKSGLESLSQQSSYGDSLSYTYSTYGSGSEPDYIMMEIRIKQQADDLSHLQRLNKKLCEDLELERCQGMQRLKKLEASAKAAEKRIQELSVELARSQETVKYYQELQETQEAQMQELAANREAQDDRKRVEARIQQLEAEIAQGKEEMKNGNYESTQQRAAIRKALDERCIAQRLLEASEKERRDLEKKLAELERLNQRQEKALGGAAQSWLKKNHEMDVMCEELRWRMVDSKSGIVVGGHNKQRGSTAAGGKSQHPAPNDSASAAGKAGEHSRPKTAAASSNAVGAGKSANSRPRTEATASATANNAKATTKNSSNTHKA